MQCHKTLNNDKFIFNNMKNNIMTQLETNHAQSNNIVHARKPITLCCFRHISVVFYFLPFSLPVRIKNALLPNRWFRGVQCPLLLLSCYIGVKRDGGFSCHVRVTSIYRHIHRYLLGTYVSVNGS